MEPSTLEEQKRMALQIVHTTEEFYSLRERWNSLLQASPSNSFFLTWEWLWSWWNAYREDASQLFIMTFFRNDRLIGIAPFYVNSNCKIGPLRIRRLMFLGTREGAAQSEYMDIIAHADYAPEIAAEIVHYISQENICDDIQLEKIDESSRSISLLQEAGERSGLFFHIQCRLESPFIKLPATHNDFLGRVSSRVRHSIRNNHKKLQKKYVSVIFRKTTNESELENDFAELARLHQLRWQSRQLPGSFSRDNYISFHKSAMKEMMEKGNLDLWFLSVDGRAIAALYNINYNNKIYNYQAGIDIEFDPSIAPGILLHNHCIAAAIGEGLGEYDFLAMGKRDAYKKNWTDTSNFMVDIYMVRPGVKKYIAVSLIKLRTQYRKLKSLLRQIRLENAGHRKVNA